MDTIRKPLNFNVKGNSYKVTTPTAGQLWDIEEMKARLSNGHYGNVLRNRTFWSEYNLDTIDMFSYITVLCPELIEDLKVDTWKDLDPFDLAELKKQYKSQFLPWLTALNKALKSAETDQDDQ